MKTAVSALMMMLLMTILTGVIYPYGVTALSRLTMSEKAGGSLIRVGDKVVGSALIAQKFEGEKYFWPRPSASDYNALASGGSNLGPISSELKKQVDERRLRLSKWKSGEDKTALPIQMLFASGSGLDPHINRKAALFQVDRVVKARKLKAEAKKEIEVLVEAHLQPRFLRVIGKQCVNVLLLNIALDELEANMNKEGGK